MIILLLPFQPTFLWYDLLTGRYIFYEMLIFAPSAVNKSETSETSSWWEIWLLFLCHLANWCNVLRPKMNCTVRFGKQFSESSPCLPGQQGTGQQGWYASGTLRKQFTKPTVQFILGRSTAFFIRSVARFWKSFFLKFPWLIGRYFGLLLPKEMLGTWANSRDTT